jgi:thioredoxin-dependent peroxiredoxin
MATIALGGNPVQTNGSIPQPGTQAPNFKLTAQDLTEVTLADFKGKKLILNIFPSIDTATCALSVRQFNQHAADLEGVQVVCVSRDLPFAQKRFCGAEGIQNIICLSDFKSGAFGQDYGLELLDSKLAALHARAVVVVDATGIVLHSELVEDIANEPDYKAALAVL